MSDVKRVEITRSEFIQAFGLVPSEDVIGVCFTNVAGTVITAEYIFVDEGSKQADITELERIYSL